MTRPRLKLLHILYVLLDNKDSIFVYNHIGAHRLSHPGNCKRLKDYHDTCETHLETSILRGIGLIGPTPLGNNETLSKEATE